MMAINIKFGFGIKFGFKWLVWNKLRWIWELCEYVDGYSISSFLVNRISLTLSCPMNLKLYPLDRQMCSLLMISCKLLSFVLCIYLPLSTCRCPISSPANIHSLFSSELQMVGRLKTSFSSGGKATPFKLPKICTCPVLCSSDTKPITVTA